MIGKGWSFCGKDIRKAYPADSDRQELNVVNGKLIHTRYDQNKYPTYTLVTSQELALRVAGHMKLSLEEVAEVLDVLNPEARDGWKTCEEYTVGDVIEVDGTKQRITGAYGVNPDKLAYVLEDEEE